MPNKGLKNVLNTGLYIAEHAQNTVLKMFYIARSSKQGGALSLTPPLPRMLFGRPLGDSFVLSHFWLALGVAFFWRSSSAVVSSFMMRFRWRPTPPSPTPQKRMAHRKKCNFEVKPSEKVQF